MNLRASIPVLALFLAACGGETEPPKPPEPPEPKTIEFQASFEAAAKKAGDADALVFVVAARLKPHCPGCAALRKTVFTKPESVAISDRWPAVVFLGGDDETPETRALFDRVGVQGFPTLLAMTASGEVVDGDLLKRRRLDAAGIVEEMEKAVAAQTAFVAERDAILAEADPARMLELAARYRERRAPAAVLATRVRVAQATEDPHDWLRVCDAAQDAGDAEAEQRAIEHLMKTWPDADRRSGWQIRKTTIALPPLTGRGDAPELVQQHVDALDTLRATMASDPAREAHVRLFLADLLLKARRAKEGKPHLVWIVEHDAGSDTAGAAHLRLARRAIRRGDLPGVTKHAEAVLETKAVKEDRVEALSTLAELAFAREEVAEVIRLYEVILEIAPESRAAERARLQLPELRAQMEK